MRELIVTWNTIKNVKTRDSLCLYYVQFPQGTDPETYEYDVFGTNQVYVYRSNIAGSDATDFETNFKSNATSVSSFEDAIALNVPVISSQYMPEQVWEQNRQTTSSTTKTIIVSSTVPANKDLYIVSYALARITNNNMEACPATLEVLLSGTSTVQTKLEQCLRDGNGWKETYSVPLKIASAGDTLRLTVSAASVASTIWSASLIGILRSR